ncbi:MAG: hypothetical protein AB7V13_11665 [Pseudorhodoplanes sp.]|uniref:hypothetical protein n=1 Tax=Pseudorhodoplanes sp. TaxID=1934341 RepID=UPI003D106182
MKILCAGGIVTLMGAIMLLGASADAGAVKEAQVARSDGRLSQNVTRKRAARKPVVIIRRRAAVIDSRSPYYRRPGIAPSFGYIGPPGYAGEYAWRKSIGQCVEDLGYGRWAACPSW